MLLKSNSQLLTVLLSELKHMVAALACPARLYPICVRSEANLCEIRASLRSARRTRGRLTGQSISLSHHSLYNQAPHHSHHAYQFMSIQVGASHHDHEYTSQRYVLTLCITSCPVRMQLFSQTEQSIGSKVGLP